jgi:hypothetical protein
MADPRFSKGDAQPWPGGNVSPHAEFWRPIQTFHVELACPSCQRGHLVATGETHEMGNAHHCNGCGATWRVPGEPYPRRVERIVRVPGNEGTTGVSSRST